MTDTINSELDNKSDLITLPELQQIREKQKFNMGVWDDKKLEIAVDGVNEYQKLTNNLDSDLAKKIKEDPGIQNCFLGSTPVQHFKERFNSEEVDKINQALLLRGNKFLILSYKYNEEYTNTALVNVKAATEVMKQNTDILIT